MWSSGIVQPPDPDTHHLFGAVLAGLVGPVQGELLFVYLVAGIESAGEADGRAVQSIEGGWGHQLHAQRVQH